MRDNRQPHKRVKQESEKQQRESQSKRLVFRRTAMLMLMFGVGLFVPLIHQIWNIAVVDHEYYQKKAVEQQTRDVSVSAERGNIYDSNGNVMAMSATVYNLILSPRDLVSSIDKKEYTKDGVLDQAAYERAIQEKRDLITDKVCAVLGMERESVAKRMTRTDSAYEVIKKNVDGEQAEELRAFIAEHKLGYSMQMIPTNKRYYPYGSMAAQVLGFCNENGGAYGLEAWYNDTLEGTAGRVVTTKTGNGTEIYNSYSEYMDPSNGYHLNLTIDTTIQAFAEKTLEEGIKEYDVEAGGWCIVMNPKTGAIYAMASSPEYDPNNYGTVMDEKLNKILEAKRQELNGVEGAYNQAVSNALNKQWRSQAYMDTYEPGSTFKALVLYAALEEGVVSENDTFYCSGSAKVPGWNKPISCSKKEGHGSQTLAQAVQHSCNPAFMEIGARLGIDTFYEYFKAFGLYGNTGLDLPGEASNTNLIWPQEKMSNVDLAVASFGQRFQVTPIQMITAFSAVINGGDLVHPYVVDSITDDEGNIISKTEPTVVRQVISQQTSEKATAILESVVADPEDGTGHKAYQAGYRIGGKTGTSETSVPGEVVVSFMAFAPADDPEVIVLLAYNTPARSAPGSSIGTTGTFISGGNMPAHKMGPLMGEILDYLGVEKQYTAEEAATVDVSVPQVVGLDEAGAKATLKKKNLTYRIVGDGQYVSAQVPAQGTAIPGGSTVILYMGGQPEETSVVPSVSGLGYEDAKKKLEAAGFFMRASGASTYYGNASKAQSQSHAAGDAAAMGTVVDVVFSTPEVNDGYIFTE